MHQLSSERKRERDPDEGTGAEGATGGHSVCMRVSLCASACKRTSVVTQMHMHTGRHVCVFASRDSRVKGRKESRQQHQEEDEGAIRQLASRNTHTHTRDSF